MIDRDEMPDVSALCAGDHIGEVGHERGPLAYDVRTDTLRCLACGFVATPSRVDAAIPPAFRRSGEPLIAMLQALADYRCNVVFGRSGATVEYPRASSAHR